MSRLERGDLVYIAYSIDSDTLRKSLDERALQLRRDAGVSQEDFADACRFARIYMRRIERGTSNLSLDGIQRLVVVFGISVEKLFRGL